MEAEITFGQCYLPLLTTLRRDDHKVILIDGNRGSGKTRAILSVLMCHALKNPGTRWALWRSTRTRLTDTVLYTLETQVFSSFGIPVPGKAGAVNRSSYELSNGSMFIPIGLDDIFRSTSAEFAGGYLNEGAEIGSMTQVEALTASLRQVTATFQGPHQLYIDTNPDFPGHWLNKRAQKEPEDVRALPTDRAHYDRIQLWNSTPSPDPVHKWKRILTGHEDNPGYFDLDKWELTKQGRSYVENTLQGMTGHLRERWLNRRWIAAEGSVFPEFTAEKNVIPAFEVPADWPVWMCIDPGYDHPCGVSWNTIAPNGCKYTIAEVKVRQTSIPDLARLIRAKRAGGVNGIYLDPRGAFQKTQVANGITFKQQLEKEGLSGEPWPPCQKEQTEARVAAHRKDIIDRRYKVFDTCSETINEHQSWAYKRNASGEQLTGDDAFQDRDNDILDGVMGWGATKPVFRPAKVRIYEPQSTVPIVTPQSRFIY